MRAPFPTEITVNWHLLEPCNFRCRYCFARWEADPPDHAKIHSHGRKLIAEARKLVGAIVSCTDGPILIKSVRLNFAGGEPFLFRDLGDFIERAHGAGLAPSFISNGSQIRNDFIDKHARQISMAGFSVDTADPETMRHVGRADRRGRTLDPARLGEMVSRFRNVNPGIRIKINTVVCAENVYSDLRLLLETIQPERWKVLRVLPVLGATPVADDDFQQFLDRHRGVPGMSVENNDDMRGSYVMLDPGLRVFQNTRDGRYEYSAPVTEIGLAEAIAQMPFFAEKHRRRYV